MTARCPSRRRYIDTQDRPDPAHGSPREPRPTGLTRGGRRVHARSGPAIIQERGPQLPRVWTAVCPACAWCRRPFMGALRTQGKSVFSGRSGQWRQVSEFLSNSWRQRLHCVETLGMLGDDAPADSQRRARASARAHDPSRYHCLHSTSTYPQCPCRSRGCQVVRHSSVHRTESKS